MSLIFFAAAIAVVPVSGVDLQSPTVLVSKATREQIARGEVARLSCIDVSHRSNRLKQVCLSATELQTTQRLAEQDARYKQALQDISLPQWQTFRF
jgi:hypothetical protein